MSAAAPAHHAPDVVPGQLLFAQLASVLLLAFVAMDLWLPGAPDFLLFLDGSVTSVLTAHFLIVSLRARRMILFGFALFVLYDVLIVWLVNYTLNVPIPQWRLNGVTQSLLIECLKEYFIYTSLFLVVAYSCLIFIEARKKKDGIGLHLESYVAPRDDNVSRWLLLALSILAMTVLAYAIGGVSRETFAMDSSVSDRFMVRAGADLVALALILSLYRQRKSLGIFRPIAILPVFATIFAMAAGFRYLFVFLAFVMLGHYTFNHRTSLGKLFALGLLGFFSILALLIIGYSRSFGISALDLFNDARIINGMSVDVLLQQIGGPQQLNTIALHTYLHSDAPLLHGRTYIDAIIGILPNGIRSSLITIVRPQDYIIQTAHFLQRSFLESGHTMGASVEIEGIINFGPLGGFVAILAYLVFFTFLELKRGAGPNWFVLYVVVLGNTFQAAWYGSANFIKESLFILALSFIFFEILRLFRGSTVRLPVTSG